MAAHPNLGQTATQRLGDHVLHERRNPSGRGPAEKPDRLSRQILRAKQPCPRRVIDVVIDIGNQVGDPHDLAFDRARPQRVRHAHRRAGLPFRMLGDAVADLPRQVEASAVVLQ